MFSVTLDIIFTDNCKFVVLYFQGLQTWGSVKDTSDEQQNNTSGNKYGTGLR